MSARIHRSLMLSAMAAGLLGACACGPRCRVPVSGVTWSGKSAYTFVPNWRELGRFSNLDPVPLPGDQVGRYHVVFSRYLVRCSG